MMKQEYSFTLTIPVADIQKVQELLAEAKIKTPALRISRKTDRAGCARFYLSFPFSNARPDLSFEKWFVTHKETSWDLFGPTYGRWGFC
jgi:hypothetical protein